MKEKGHLARYLAFLVSGASLTRTGFTVDTNLEKKELINSAVGLFILLRW